MNPLGSRKPFKTVAIRKRKLSGWTCGVVWFFHSDSLVLSLEKDLVTFLKSARKTLIPPTSHPALTASSPIQSLQKSRETKQEILRDSKSSVCRQLLQS